MSDDKPSLYVGFRIDPKEYSAEGFAAQVLQHLSTLLTDPQVKQWNDKRKPLCGLKITSTSEKEAFTIARFNTPARGSNDLSYAEVLVNWTPRTEEEFGRFATRMESVADAIELMDLMKPEVWVWMLLFQLAHYLETAVDYRLDRAQTEEYAPVPGLANGWDHQKGFFGYIPYKDDKYIELVITFHRIFVNAQFKPPQD